MGGRPIANRISRATAYATSSGLGPALLRAVTGTGLVQLAAMAASFAVGVQLARLLGAQGYGYYGMALAVVTVAGIPGQMGLPRLVTREVAGAVARKDLPMLFGILRWADRLAWWISAIMAIAVIVGASFLTRGPLSGLQLALLLGAPTIPLLALARIRGGSLQGLQHVVLGQVPAILIRPLLLSLLLAAAYLVGIRMGAPAAMALNSVTAAAVFLVADILLRQRLPKTKPPEVVRNGRRWLASSIPLAMADGMIVLQSEMSILLVGIFAAATEAGLFRIATVTAATAATAIPIVNYAAVAFIARLYAEEDMARLQKAVTRFAQAQFFGVLVLSLPLFVAAEPLLGLVFGADYVPASNAIRILLVGQVVNGAFGPNAALLNMTHHERRVTRAMAIALVLNVTLVALLTGLWGMLGAATGVSTALLAWNVITWMDAKRIVGIDTFVFPAAHARQKTP